jgi:hypothetical protein
MCLCVLSCRTFKIPDKVKETISRASRSQPRLPTTPTRQPPPRKNPPPNNTPRKTPNDSPAKLQTFGSVSYHNYDTDEYDVLGSRGVKANYPTTAQRPDDEEDENVEDIMRAYKMLREENVRRSGSDSVSSSAEGLAGAGSGKSKNFVDTMRGNTKLARNTETLGGLNVAGVKKGSHSGFDDFNQSSTAFDEYFDDEDGPIDAIDEAEEGDEET